MTDIRVVAVCENAGRWCDGWEEVGWPIHVPSDMAVSLLSRRRKMPKPSEFRWRSLKRVSPLNIRVCVVVKLIAILVPPGSVWMTSEAVDENDAWAA